MCSTGNVELVRSIGAAHIVDYTTEDFTDGRVHYDVILDNVGSRPLSRLRRTDPDEDPREQRPAAAQRQGDHARLDGHR